MGVVGALVGHRTRGSGEDAKTGHRAAPKQLVKGASRLVKSLGANASGKASARPVPQAVTAVPPTTMKPDRPRLDLLGLPLLPFLE